MKRLFFFLFLACTVPKLVAQAPFIGEVRLFAGNFAPKGWALCNGQIINISTNTALFALLGTTYGGDGIQTFALPDLRSRVPVHAGISSSSGRIYILGEQVGTETNTLTVSNIPAHTHIVAVTQKASAQNGTSDDPTNRVLASPGVNAYTEKAADVNMLQQIVTSSVAGGGNYPILNIQPSLALNYIICVSGVFPARN